MAKEMSVGAEFSGGSEEVTSHLYQTYPDRSQPSSDVFCPQEDLRTQLRKMEAGASDKDKVEAPTGIMEMCSIFYCTDKCEKRKRTIARFVSCRSLDSYRIIKMYSHFPAVYYVWCKDVKGAIFG